MLYRGKRYIVTVTFDGHWAWVVILSSRLSIRGRAITKFEAIEQAMHLIDRIIWFRTRQSLPCSRYERLKRFVFGFLGKITRKLLVMTLNPQSDRHNNPAKKNHSCTADPNRTSLADLRE
jgi:hypothetical protein